KNQGQPIFDAHIKGIMPFLQPMKSPLIRAFPSTVLIWKKCGVQLSQFVASKFGYGFIYYSARQVHSNFRQKLCIQQRFCYFLIAIVAAAIANICYIATLKHTLDNEIGFSIIVEVFKINVPKNTSVKYRFRFVCHNAKIYWIFLLQKRRKICVHFKFSLIGEDTNQR